LVHRLAAANPLELPVELLVQAFRIAFVVLIGLLVQLLLQNISPGCFFPAAFRAAKGSAAESIGEGSQLWQEME